MGHLDPRMGRRPHRPQHLRLGAPGVTVHPHRARRVEGDTVGRVQRRRVGRRLEDAYAHPPQQRRRRRHERQVQNLESDGHAARPAVEVAAVAVLQRGPQLGEAGAPAAADANADAREPFRPLRAPRCFDGGWHGDVLGRRERRALPPAILTRGGGGGAQDVLVHARAGHRPQQIGQVGAREAARLREERRRDGGRRLRTAAGGSARKAARSIRKRRAPTAPPNGTAAMTPCRRRRAAAPAARRARSRDGRTTGRRLGARESTSLARATAAPGGQYRPSCSSSGRRRPRSGARRPATTTA